MKTAYLKGESIWKVKAKDDQPWCWRKLLKLRDRFKHHSQTAIGDGQQASLFFDNWLASGPIADASTCIWGSTLNMRSGRRIEGGIYLLASLEDFLGFLQNSLLCSCWML